MMATSFRDPAAESTPQKRNSGSKPSALNNNTSGTTGIMIHEGSAAINVDATFRLQDLTTLGARPGPGWFDRDFLYGSRIRYSMPVYPGAFDLSPFSCLKNS
jgi:hypothetical protein